MGEQAGGAGSTKLEPREQFSQPSGRLRSTPGEGHDAEHGGKRRKLCGSQEAPRPPGQGPVTVCASAIVRHQLGAFGPMRSSLLGQALLRDRGANVSDSMRGSELLAECTLAVPQWVAELPVVSAQSSALGGADGAESRVRLKRRRVVGNPGLEQTCSPGALDALAACRDVEVGSAVAACPAGPRYQVGRGGSSSSGPSGPC